MKEKTLVLIKPDAVEKRLIGAILFELERNGLNILHMKMMKATPALAEQHYAELADKPFFPKIIDYITRGPLVALIIEGENAIQRVRDLAGTTDPAESKDNTIRALYGKDKTENTFHASDSIESAEREMKLWFGEVYDN